MSASTITVEVVLLDGCVESVVMSRGSTLADVLRQLDVSHPGRQVAVDEDDAILTPDFVFDRDAAICLVVVARWEARK